MRLPSSPIPLKATSPKPAGFGYAAGGVVLPITMNETGGVLTVRGVPVTVTATGGKMPTFRYAVLYNDTQTSPLKPLVAFWDVGSTALNDTDSCTLRFDVIFTDG